VKAGGGFAHTKERLEHARNKPDDLAVVGDAYVRGVPVWRQLRLGGRGDECDALYLSLRNEVINEK